MTKKTVVGFSGGWDSTFLMWKLLTETDDEITAIYLNGESVTQHIFTNKSQIQYTRAQKVIEELQKIRTFSFVTHVLDEGEITSEINNKILLFIQHVAPMINDGTYDRLTFGSSYEDQHRRVIPHLEYTSNYYASKRLFDKLCTRGEYFIPLVDTTWYPKYTKAYALVELPDNIKNVIASCQEPVYDSETDSFDNCGECGNCVIIEKFKELLDSGMTPNEIVTWRLNKASEYGDGTVMVGSPNDIDWLALEMGKPGAMTKEQIQNSTGELYFKLKFSVYKDEDKNYEHYNNDIWRGLVYPEK
jgi:hypothetical protein